MKNLSKEIEILKAILEDNGIESNTIKCIVLSYELRLIRENMLKSIETSKRPDIHTSKEYREAMEEEVEDSK